MKTDRLKKLVDSNDQVSILGRADQYQMERPLKPKHSTNVVGGADNGIDQFAIIRKYHLKGFEYGNWVSNNDRYDHLLAAQRSLEHLAKILGTTNIGINGNIGIAFGGRGQGGFAAAHYEPGLNMINLTKPHGAGCLAHEYGHALDYNFGSFIDQNKKYAALSGGRSTAQTLEDNTGGQLRAMMNKLIDLIVQTDTHKEMRKKVTGDYWIRRTEVFARFFEQYICYKMRKISTDAYLTHKWSDYTSPPMKYFYLSEKEFMNVLPVADQLCAEFAMFLNGKSKLVTTPYPTAKRLKKVVKNAKLPKAAPKQKTEGEKAVERIKRRNERIRQRTEAAIANHKIEQLRKVQCDREEQKAKAKAKKAAFNKAMLKKNPDWIKTFTIRIGLPKATIEAMYNITAKDELRPVINGIYCDEKGYIVATDAHILVAIKCSVPKSYAGKIYAPSGQTIEGRYPNWQAVMPTTYTKTGTISKMPSPQVTEVSINYQRTKVEVVDHNSARLMYNLLKKIQRVFDSMKEPADVKQLSRKEAETRANEYVTAEQVIAAHSVLFVSKSVKAIQMPVLKA